MNDMKIGRPKLYDLQLRVKQTCGNQRSSSSRIKQD
jgi:hypothetical protein